MYVYLLHKPSKRVHRITRETFYKGKEFKLFKGKSWHVLTVTRLVTGLR